ncbi:MULTISPECIES: TMEM175 family protein [Micrococcaceae]|uniref:Membrane protein n=2 Tax=Micrococcaceae TaxID=1268 RepID=A0AAJ1SPP6_9MICC|nr:TMEM175 family protein [Pseudarthrobacter niigatensis]MDQ0144755.1 putative membrane protein [Pseudarthrobacter niigatensis]MDQ0265402.1 putative membrane protein [Pseudarthrobacter niigatensis]
MAALSTYDKFKSLVSSGTDTERTSFFSDAIFAIAMTLLAVEIRVPEVPPEELPHALLEQGAQYFAYVLSFAVTGAYWLTHHRLFRLLRAYDANLQRINLVALLFIALTGFGSGVLARYGDQPAGVVVYAVIISGMGLSYTALWQYAWHRKLFGSDIDARLFSYMRARSLAVPLVFLASIPVAFFSPAAAEYLWLGVLALDAALSLAYRRRPATPGRARPTKR